MVATLAFTSYIGGFGGGSLAPNSMLCYKAGVKLPSPLIPSAVPHLTLFEQNLKSDTTARWQNLIIILSSLSHADCTRKQMEILC